jgi:uncharacterized protein
MKTSFSKKVITFLVLTFALSSIFYYLIISSRTFPTSYALGIMWCPGLAAIVTQLIFNRSLRGMGWKLGQGRYLLASYLLPLAYVAMAYLLIWLTGFGKFDPAALEKFISEANGPSSTPFGVVGTYFVYMLTLGFLVNCFAVLGEEIGWRGLLVPELAKTNSFIATSLISGGVWSIYHWPLILSGQYSSEGTPAWFALACFTIMVIGVSFPFAWLRLKSKSLWGAVIMHAAHNLFIQAIFNQLTSDTGLTNYASDEFGVGLALVGLILAFIFWRKRDEIDDARKLSQTT